MGALEAFIDALPRLTIGRWLGCLVLGAGYWVLGAILWWLMVLGAYCRKGGIHC